MFSIQQLIKTLRKLQTNGASGDLAKSLQYAATAGNSSGNSSGNNSNIVEHYNLDAESAAVACLTSLLTTSVSPPKQQTSASSQSQQQQRQQISAEKSYENQVNSSSSSINSNTNDFSLYSHLNASGSSSELTPTLNVTTQKHKITTTTTTTTKTTTSPSATLAHFHINSSNQRIQNFYQQQFHQFHTQSKHSRYAKQKQTHFTMSSLAAEPLALKPTDDIVSNGNGTTTSATKTAAASTSPLSSSSSSSSSASGKPCFQSGFAEMIQFMELIGNLKHTKRTGWVLRDVNDCESISGHMYRMSMMTFLLDGTEGLNQIRCMELALVHDLAESLVGDITPFCGISKDDKRAMEFKAMDDICKLIEPRGKRIMELFEEYETGESAESKFVKDLDRLDMVMQAFEYEKRDNCLLKHQEFFDSTEGKFKHPFVQQLVAEIYEQRKCMAKEQGATPPPTIVVPDWEAAATHNNHHNGINGNVNGATKGSNGHCAAATSATTPTQEEPQKQSSTTS